MILDHNGQAISSALLSGTSAPVAFLGGHYSAVESTKERTNIAWATAESDKEISEFDRQSLIKISRILESNVGFIAGIVAGIVSLRGYLMPFADTSDEDFNERCDELILARLMNSALFDISGKYNFFTAQLMQNRMEMTDGDHLSVFGRNEYGTPALKFYESASLRGKGKNDADGVRTNKHGRHEYYVIDGKESAAVPAGRCHYYGRFRRVGYRRSVPPIAHGLNDARDVVDIIRFIKKVIKNNAQFGAFLTSQPQLQAGFGNTSHFTPPGSASAGGNNAPNAANFQKPIDTAGQVQTLPPGFDVKSVSDDRPTSETMKMLGFLLRNIAAGTGYSTEVLWELGTLTSPGVRFQLSKAQRAVNIDHTELQRPWCEKVWRYFVSDALEKGELDYPKNPDEWAKVDLVAQSDPTIDRATDRDQINLINSGLSTFKEYHGRRGTPWRRAIRQRVKEIVFAKKEVEDAREQNIEIDYDDVIQRPAGAAKKEEREPLDSRKS